MRGIQNAAGRLMNREKAFYPAARGAMLFEEPSGMGPAFVGAQFGRQGYGRLGKASSYHPPSIQKHASRMGVGITRGHRFDLKNRKIEWAMLGACNTRGLILAPPLIGGTFAQQLNLLRWLAKMNLAIISFNYSGHGKSTDKFSLKTSIDNTMVMASEASKMCRQTGLPLLGIGGCYSAIPLLFTAHKLSEPFSRVVLINPLIDLKPSAVIKSFLDYYQRLNLKRGFKKNIIEAMKKYTEFLFPDIAKDKNSFGVLNYERTHLWNVIFEFLFFTPLKKTILNKTRVLCLYAKNDPVLNIYSKDGKQYESHVRKVCPLTSFKVIDGDHFFQPGSARNDAQKTISTFFET
ncbi:MAG: hypothetical protein V2J65_26115 [Desulfobacteraceae bacterium]|nr:hypothetical protein [Desulfobacteraceae bacterium]